MSKVKYPVIIDIELFDELHDAVPRWISEYRVIYAINIGDLYEKISRYVKQKYPDCIDFNIEFYLEVDKYEI